MGGHNLAKPAVDPSLFPLDPEVVFLNHGSFGSCPIEVLEHQNQLRLELEKQPVRFLGRNLEGMLDQARDSVAKFVGADLEDLILVPNATSGVNTVLRSIPIEPGEELLVTDHEYNACRNAIHYAAEKRRAKVVTVEIPFPLNSPEEVIEAVMEKVTDKTRLFLIDHVTSPTGLILPVEEIIGRLSCRGIDTFVDGAHAPGMIPVNIEALGAAYYTANCHKWMCAPKTAAFLWVRNDKKENIRPLTISHGANSKRTDRSGFQIEFAWMGTRDPTAILSVPRVLEYLEGLLPGGWPEIMDRNRHLALAARKLLCDTCNIPFPCPDSMIGSMVSIPLVDSREDFVPQSPLFLDYLQDELMERCNIEIPVIPWPAFPKRLIRLSAQLYNCLPQYDLLTEGIQELVVESVA